MKKKSRKIESPPNLPWDPALGLPAATPRGEARPKLGKPSLLRRAKPKAKKVHKAEVIAPEPQVSPPSPPRVAMAIEINEPVSPKEVVVRVGTHQKSSHILDLRRTPLMSPAAVSIKKSPRTPEPASRDLRRIAPPTRQRNFRFDELLVVSLIEVLGMIIHRAWFALVAFFVRASEMVLALSWKMQDWFAGERVEELGQLRSARVYPAQAKRGTRPRATRFAWSIPRFGFQPGFARALASFVFLLLISLLPMAGLSSLVGLATTKNEIIKTGRAGQAGLLAAGSELAQGDWGSATILFQNSAQSFATTLQEIQTAEARSLHLGSLLPGTRGQVRTVKALASVGNLLARTGEMMTRSFELTSGEGMLGRVEALSQSAKAAIPLAREAARQAERIEIDVIPQEEQAGVAVLQDAVGKIASGLQSLPPLAQATAELLGKSTSKRYLVIFQNNNELRATGGFIGSFAEITIDRGEIKDMKIPGGGSYDLQGDLRAAVRAPEPLRLVSARWHFHDANWFADFPTSAQKLSWFYEKGNGPTVDGVIALTASAVQDLLREVGLIAMPAYGREISADNFVAETQKIVELEYDKTENKPKQFIADLAPVLLDRIKNGDAAVLKGVVTSLGTSLREKHALIWMRDESLQSLVSRAGWAGEIKNASQDYLLVVDTNIAGQKTDEVIREEVLHDARIESDGSVVDTVTIRRTHNGVRGALFTGVRNVDFLRVYVPLGSELLAASGDFRPPQPELFETPDATLGEDQDLSRVAKIIGTEIGSGTVVGEETGRTVFGNWLQVDPGETVIARFTYRLPFRVVIPGDTGLLGKLRTSLRGPATAPYTLLVQKQPGTNGRVFTTKLVPPPDATIRWQYPGLLRFVGDNPESVPLDHDMFFGVLMSK